LNILDISSLVFDIINLNNENLTVLNELDHSWNCENFYSYNIYIFLNILVDNKKFFNILGESDDLNLNIINFNCNFFHKIFKESFILFFLIKCI
jgi:hypothetical protein